MRIQERVVRAADLGFSRKNIHESRQMEKAPAGGGLAGAWSLRSQGAAAGNRAEGSGDAPMDIKTMVDTYRGWCAGLAPVNLKSFLDEIDRLCGKLGVRIEPGNDQRVYAHGVRIEAPKMVPALVEQG